MRQQRRQGVDLLPGSHQPHRARPVPRVVLGLQELGVHVTAAAAAATGASVTSGGGVTGFGVVVVVVVVGAGEPEGGLGGLGEYDAPQADAVLFETKQNKTKQNKTKEV